MSLTSNFRTYNSFLTVIKLTIIGLCVLFKPIISVATAPPIEKKPLIFPVVQSNNLHREPLKVPHGLAGKLNLILVAFHPQQQPVIDTWIEGLDKLESSNQGFKFYEIPLLAQEHVLMKPVIENWMRDKITTTQMRKKVIYHFANKNKFKKTLLIPDEQNIYLFLVNKKGEVIWESSGASTISKLEELSRVVEKRLKS
ncbi:MAG: hypothetical protein K2X66_11120 [Cyanobacteria bacterium]|nr:hypothetical protein [Cyanobacteriota bacterium]